METLGSNNKIVGLVEKWVMPVTVVVFLLHYSILKHRFDGFISDLKTYLLVVIGILFVINLITYAKKNGLKNLPVSKWTITFLVIFFVIRCISIIKCDFDYSVIKEVFYEGIFLVAISQYTVTEKMNMKMVAACFIVCVTMMNVLNIWSYHYAVIHAEAGDNIMTWLSQFVNPVINRGAIYTNSNTGGILTGISLLMSLLFIKDNRKNFIWIVPVWLIGIYSLYLLFARSSYVAFAAALISIVLLIFFEKMSPRTLTILSMVAGLCVTGIICSYILFNNWNGNTTFTDTETQINTVTSGRYKIWEDILISHEGKWILGLGSYELEINDRNEYLLNQHIESGGEESDFVPTIYHTHNAYIGVFVYTGIFAGIIFFIILGNKILNAYTLRGKKSNRWTSIVLASILIYIFFINIVEPYFIGKRHIEFLLLLIILAWNIPDQKERKIYEGCYK